VIQFNFPDERHTESVLVGYDLDENEIAVGYSVLGLYFEKQNPNILQKCDASVNG